jgi:Putative auto-transporter adhesin, head GIN domain
MHFATHSAARARRQTLALITSGALSAAALLVVPVSHATTTSSGNATSEVRAANGSQAISLRSSIDLVVRQGNSEGVMVRADDNILPLVQTLVEGSGDARTLRIQFKAGESLRTKTPVVVTVDVVNLNAVASSGSGNITIEALKAPTLTLSISGSSDAKLRELDIEQLNISIAGSGDVQASGRAAKLDVSIAGSGDVRMRELAAGDVGVSIAGSGDASVTAQRTISVAIAGSGDVDYCGGATLAKRSIAGSGTVRQRQP